MANYNTLPDYSGITGPMSQNYGANNALQTGLYGQAASSLAKPLDFSGLSSLPTADQTGRNQMTDAVYGQQARYLDPQFSQAQSDLTSRLANQGIMMGSDAYNREMNNFNLQRTAAYGDARDRAIQQGGAEQSRMFDMGLQARKEGINEQLAQRNAPLEALQSLNGINTATTNGLFSAANNLYSAGVGNQNANVAQQTNFNNGLYSLAGAAIQNPQAVKSGYDWLSGLYSQYAS